jgi:hypothetical protein
MTDSSIVEKVAPNPFITNLRHGYARHDGSRSAAYKAWAAMIVRCYGKRNIKKQYWMGRGITVCDRWRRDFMAFLADMGNPPPGKRISLDRINNNGPYSPENCRWATPRQQSRNSRNAKITLEQATEICREALSGGSPTEIAKRYGVSRALVRAIRSGRRWPEAVAAAERGDAG